MHRLHVLAFAMLLAGSCTVLPNPCRAAARSAAPGFTLEQVLAYPFPQGLAAAPDGDHIAWVVNQSGVRNVWIAQAPGFEPRQTTRFAGDDGQEITQLTFSPDGRSLVFVRGGDHDANWPAKTPPDVASSPTEPKVMLWVVDQDAATAHELVEGDAPALSATGALVYIKEDQVWTAPMATTAKDKPRRLFFDRGKDTHLRWSPDGKRLAFVSNRDDHAFIGVFTNDTTPIQFLAPSTGIDGSPRWSPDGKRIAYTRQRGKGGAPQPILALTPQPWSIWVADADTGLGHAVWKSPDTLVGSYPQTQGEANLHWANGGSRLVFVATLDNWPHLYSIADEGGAPLLLTPGEFMVEDVVMAPDRRSVIYSANTGATKDDDDRRHLFRVPTDRAQPHTLTSGTHIHTSPVATGNTVAYIDAGAQRPPLVAVMAASGAEQRVLQPDSIPREFPSAQFVIPQAVSFRAADGTPVHGQLFRRADAQGNQPGVIFVHGGPPRQMLLGWHYMDYYSNSYAVNQYLAAHGFTVLSVNYRLGIGYGFAFRNPQHWGPTGAAEYQDVVAGAKFLQQVPGVDPARIGIWGGSYGGYLTALALARNSDIFKAGVDLHGIHDWSQMMDEIATFNPLTRFEQGDYKGAMKVAWESSPDADMDKWKSPVLLIQGDDDRNVHFAKMTDVVPRLREHGVPFEEMVIPDEIHGFLLHSTWLRVDAAAVDFLERKLDTRRGRDR